MAERKSRALADEVRVPFGVPALDQMLDGGLMARRPYLLVGPSGTGKTTLALQFLIEGVRRGERVLYVTLEDPPNEVRTNHRGLGEELDRVDVFDAIPDVMRYERIPFKDISAVRDVVPFGSIAGAMRQTPEFTSVEVTIAALEQMLRSHVQRREYSRLVIDSLTALQYFCMKGFEPVLGAQTFLRFLSDLRTTTLLTVESPLEDAETPERMIARGEIRLFRWERDGVTRRAIGVEKLRGSSHDVRMHPYRIGSKGLDINLGVALARDTREIAEPLVKLVGPGPESEEELPASMPGAIAEEIRDLVELGVDVSPLRTEVEAALEQVRAGRPERGAPHVARLFSRASSLADSVRNAPPDMVAATPAAAEALRRVSDRADRTRAGLPPTKLPSGGVLRAELERILADLPVAPAAGSEGSVQPRPLEEPSPVAPPAGPSSAGASAPADRSPRGVLSEGAERPSHPTPERGIADPGSSSARVRGVFARVIPEPPPLPAPAPALREVPSPSPSGGFPPPVRKRTVDPGTGVERVPPLPAPLPPASTEEPLAPEAPLPAKSPARRRRKTTAKGATAAAAASVTAADTEPGATVPAPKPRRRVVRRKKAPPVVAATAEPLPPPTDVPGPPAVRGPGER